MIPYETYARISDARELAEQTERELWLLSRDSDNSSLLAAWGCALQAWAALYTREREIALTRLAQWAVRA